MGAPGVPDILVLYRKKPITSELKSRRGQCSPSQRLAREALLRAGARWWVAKTARAAMWGLYKSGVRFRTIVHEDGTIERWQQPELPEWEVPKRSPHERRPRGPDWEPEAAAEISAPATASDDAAGGDIAARTCQSAKGSSIMLYPEKIANVNKIFLAYSFRPENDPLVRDIERIVRSQGLVLATGEILGGGALTPEIQTRIKQSDALIALLTREERIEGQELWRPTGWVTTEYTSARARDQRAIALVEEGVRLNGAYAEHEYVKLNRAAPCEAIIRLSETIHLWTIEAGRSLEIRLLPEAAATLASDENAKCEYRLISPDGNRTPWQVGRARARPGGVFLVIQGVRVDAAIEVKILDGDKPRWRSSEFPQWVHVELQNVP
jgi:hypothetical protein